MLPSITTATEAVIVVPSDGQIRRRPRHRRESTSRLPGQHEVTSVGTCDVLRADISQGHGVDTTKQVLSLAKHDRADRDMHFVDEPRLQILSDRAHAATQANVLSFSG